ncbi:DUF6268 family outer membrane beta-barrel protein [Zunongwangia sp. HGR-M22]|uniref:DUF6268 family outer membrane beta-barrel protein n=1 Tax=Zunongwangia sp. HGR-M22 TaxID=3015168 RepID=UPI0022DE169D|nr:DUF6268 family outer membrane beta-barrel protein [Zunongwangia sp. HGR-M22]WBL26624.1 DUF6268 family outer membrane beta-barrel protein [Zunongwangia sp. HGR-M22]
MKKPLKKLLFLALIVFGSISAKAQLSDLARVEYTYFPQSSSDNSFRRFRTFANFPIELGKEGTYLVPGLEYRNVNFKFEDNTDFGTYHLNRFQSFTATLGYVFNWNENWKVAIQTGAKAASNFSTNKLLNDDLIYKGAIYLIKIKKGENIEKPTRLILGLNYSTTAGFPFPLPVVNYYKEFRPQWSYMLGIPKTNIKYNLNDQNVLQAFVTLDGFYANVQDNFDATPFDQGDNHANSMSMTIVLAGLGYEYSITEHLAFYIYAGHTLMNDIRLRDDDREDVYTINDVNTFYARSGLKFSLF